MMQRQNLPETQLLDGESKLQRLEQDGKKAQHQSNLVAQPRFSLVAPRIISARSLMAERFEPVQYIIPGLLPEGLTLLSGRPKMKKSWLCLDLAIAVATGGYALGTVRAERGSVLYLALEDSPRRLQERLRKLLGNNDAPHGLDLVALDGGFPRLRDGGLAWIEAWLDENLNAKAIIIDTLARVRPPQRAGSIYEQDYQAMQDLLTVANERRVAILVVTHNRKGVADDPLEEISGSFGLSGGVDGVLVLRGKRGAKEAVLSVTGRDVPDAEVALVWNATRTTWIYQGNAEEVQVSRERRAILALFTSSLEVLTPKDIAHLLDKDPGAVRTLLHEMIKDGDIEKLERGEYKLPSPKQTTILDC